MTTTLRDIKKTLKAEGEVKIGNIEIIMDGIGGAEVTRGGEYLFSATNWAEIEDYLIEEGIAA